MEHTVKKLLVYRVKGEKRKQLKHICEELGIEFLFVSAADYGESIGALVGFPGMRKQGRAASGAGVAGEMLVFCGLDDTALDEFLDACKREGAETVACKAILTKHNAAWSGERLYTELLQERMLMQS